MQFKELLSKCQGQVVVVNNDQERTVVDIGDDFVVLQGGNPQMKVTEFVPFTQIVKMIRLEYSGGQSSVSLDLAISAGDAARRSMH